MLHFVNAQILVADFQFHVFRRQRHLPGNNIALFFADPKTVLHGSADNILW